MPAESRTADIVVCNDGSLLGSSFVVHESGEEDIAQHAFPLTSIIFELNELKVSFSANEII